MTGTRASIVFLHLYTVANMYTLVSLSCPPLRFSNGLFSFCAFVFSSDDMAGHGHYVLLPLGHWPSHDLLSSQPFLYPGQLDCSLLLASTSHCWPLLHLPLPPPQIHRISPTLSATWWTWPRSLWSTTPCQRASSGTHHSLSQPHILACLLFYHLPSCSQRMMSENKLLRMQAWHG